MKKFKEFKAEQKYISDVVLIGALIGAFVGGVAAYKGGKALWSGIQGWKETRGERKDNFNNGFTIQIKKFNDETGKIESEPVDIPDGDKRARVDNEGILKLEKAEQIKQNKINKEKASAWKKERDEEGLDDKELDAKKAKVASDEKREK